MKQGKRVASGGRTLPFIKKKASSAAHGTRNRGKASQFKLKPFLRKYRLYIVLGAILLAALLIALLIHNLLKPPPIDDPVPPPPVSGTVPEVSGSALPVTSDNPAVSGEPSQAPVYQNNDNIRTILGVASFDGSNTDTIMVGVLDHENNVLKVLSVPRDTAISFGGRLQKINAVHARTSGEADAKIDSLLTEISRLIGFRPNFDVLIRANAFKRLVNSVGGIEFDVPVRMYKPEENIDLNKGKQKLDGVHALMLLRYRGYSGSGSIPNDDYGRMYVQQQFLTAAAKQVLRPKNISKIPEFVDNFNDNVTTSLSLSDMAYFANEVAECVGADSIEFYTLPTQNYNTYHDDGKLAGAYQAIIVDEALTLLNEHFNPYTTPITEDLLQLSYYYPTRSSPLVKP